MKINLFGKSQSFYDSQCKILITFINEVKINTILDNYERLNIRIIND